MQKVLIINVNSQLGEALKGGNHVLEFEPTELNKLLEQGWEILKTDILPTSPTLYSCSVIYHLGK